MASQSYTLHNGQIVKLGRRPPRPEKQRELLRLSRYLAPRPAMPPPPSVDFTAKALASINKMYLNNTYGDCVIASAYHRIGVWTGNESGTPALATDAEVLNAYHSICGPGDNGCIITDVLDTAKTRGLSTSGVMHKIDDYVILNWTDQVEVQTAIYLFGAGCIGINLPQDWFNSPDIWDVTNSGIVGGHDVAFAGYDQNYVTILTWGGMRRMTWAAFTSRNWVDEAYIMLAPDWYNNANLSPMGVDVATLRSDLAAIGQGSIPPLPDPGPTPTPTPPPSGGSIIIDIDLRQVYAPSTLGIKFINSSVNEVRYYPGKGKINFPGKWNSVSTPPTAGRMILIDPNSRTITLPAGVKSIAADAQQPVFYPGNKPKMGVPKKWNTQ